MDEIIKKIEKEIKTFSRPQKEGESRWRVGYIDGLRKALKIIKEDKA